MNTPQIEILVEKYLRAETSLEEERILRDYFTGTTEVPAELKVYQYLFQHMDSVRSDQLANPQLESKLEAFLDRELSRKPVVFLQKPLFRLAAAAVIAAIVSTSVLIMVRNRKPDLGTYNDPELAYLEARNTLLYISQKLNYGTRELSGISKMNSGVENLRNLEKLNTSLYKLKLISKINETSTDEKQ